MALYHNQKKRKSVTEQRRLSDFPISAVRYLENRTEDPLFHRPKKAIFAAALK